MVRSLHNLFNNGRSLIKSVLDLRNKIENSGASKLYFVKFYITVKPVKPHNSEVKLFT